MFPLTSPAVAAILAFTSIAQAAPLDLNPHNTTLARRDVAPGGDDDSTYLIGYRRCQKSEGDAINAAGTLVYPPEASGLQIGQGKYLSAKNNYPMSGTSVMYCRVRAPKARWDNVAKIWVPRSWAGNDLWWNPDRIDTYINTWGAGWTADRTIRLSLIDAPGLADTQLLVTPTLVSAGGALALTAQCYDTIDELGDTPDVNYDSWQSNIDGQRTDPNPPASLPPSQGGGYS